MFSRIVVGTDGSETAKQAVREATELAKKTGASLDIVSAYDPVPAARLREERLEAPADIEHTVNPSEDVDATLAEAAKEAEAAGVHGAHLRAPGRAGRRDPRRGRGGEAPT